MAERRLKAANRYEVPVTELRQHLNPDDLGFETSSEVPPIEGILGQDRALRALQFGLQVNASGYHVYAAGPEGTGKMAAILSVLAHIARDRATPEDWCYTYNFDDPDQPRALALPAGRGKQLKGDLDRFIDRAKEAIPRAFQSENYARRRATVAHRFEERRQQMYQQIESDARQQGFAIEVTPGGVITSPLSEGRPSTMEEVNQLPEEERQRLREKGDKVKEEVEEVMRRGRLLGQEAQERIEQLDRDVARVAVGPLLEQLYEKYADLPQVIDYLGRLRKDIPEHLSDLRPSAAEGRDAAAESMLREDHLTRYRVNLIVDNAERSGAPVVVEHQPSYYNLFGRVDYRARLGNMVTDFSMVKAGTIHRANGGYLILRAPDVVANQVTWETLKRALRSREAHIENLGEQNTAVPTATLRPQNIPLNVKVVLVGPSRLYYMLNDVDEDFRQIFGVRADFALDMQRTGEHISQYAGFVSSLCHREHLRPFHKSAIARVIDHAARVAAHQQRLTTHFHEIARLIREADFWAAQSKKGLVMAGDVEQAIAEQEYRTSMLEDRLRQLILEQTVRIDTSGAVPAQVNGLSVIDLGHHAFGRPARITATTSSGTEGVVDIEREVALSGRIHSKGVLTIGGFLASRYAQERPLALSASLTFEQTYDEIEGDSASSAELYALLSSLSELPLAQGIAVTGAVNQRGEIQAIGGVNEKIEGFFSICKERRLTGEQGVIIPRDNIKHLMLKDEVVQAVQDRKFHVWGIESVDQGIELLTGVPAGSRGKSGGYPVGTVNNLVDRKLRTYAERLREFRPVGPVRQPASLQRREERRVVMLPRSVRRKTIAHVISSEH